MYYIHVEHSKVKVADYIKLKIVYCNNVYFSIVCNGS